MKDRTSSSGRSRFATASHRRRSRRRRYSAPYLPAPGCVLGWRRLQVHRSGLESYCYRRLELPSLTCGSQSCRTTGRHVRSENTAILPHRSDRTPTPTPATTSSSATSSHSVAACQPTSCRRRRTVCPLPQRMPGGGCCPEGEPWNGKSCGDAPPPPPPAAGHSCPQDRQKADGGCCQVGTKYNAAQLESAKRRRPTRVRPNRRIPGGGCCAGRHDLQPADRQVRCSTIQQLPAEQEESRAAAAVRPVRSSTC